MANGDSGLRIGGTDIGLGDGIFPGVVFDDRRCGLPKVFESHRTDELPLPRGPDVPPYLIVRKNVWESVGAVLNVAIIVREVVERLTVNRRRALRDPNFTQNDVTRGLDDGSLGYLQQEALIAEALKHHSGIGLGITGGGDCAGIADCIAACLENLRPDLLPLGVKHAGAGLMVHPDQFHRHLTFVDPLLIKDMKGQASAPFGSTRLNPLEDGNEANTLANVDRAQFIYGTGGNGNLASLEFFARQFPNKVVVGVPKTIDGDVLVDGQPVQMLGFETAVRKNQEAVYDIAQSASTHKEVVVYQMFGRKCGRLAFESARKDPKNLQELHGNPKTADLARKVGEFGNTILILVPEKPTSLLSIANEVRKRKDVEGSCVVVLAEGFVPSEVREWAEKLYNFVMEERAEGREPTRDQIIGMIEGDKRDMALKEVLKDGELAEHFLKLVYGRERGPNGKRKVKLMRLRKFVMEAIKKSGGIGKVGEGMQTYEPRGASPTEYDTLMGQKLGEKMAKVVNDGIIGGRVVVYLDGMDPRKQEPVVLDLRNVTNGNTLANEDRYPDAMLRNAGVFWKK